MCEVQKVYNGPCIPVGLWVNGQERNSLCLFFAFFLDPVHVEGARREANEHFFMPRVGTNNGPVVSNWHQR